MNHFSAAFVLGLAASTTFCDKSEAPQSSSAPASTNTTTNATVNATASATADTLRVVVGDTAVTVAAPKPTNQKAIQIAIPTVVAPAASTGGVCAELAAKCAKCPEGAVKMACNAALTAGSLDARACRDGLADHDIRELCR